MLEKKQQILKRYNDAKSNAQQWRTLLEEVYDYVIPNRSTFTKQTPGTQKDILVYDSSPLIATNKYVSRLQNLLVRPWTEWFNLTAGTDIPEEQTQIVNKYLNKISNVIMQEINHSNFSTQITEAFTDLAVSTGVLMVNTDYNPNSDSSLMFKAIPLSEVAFETSSNGDVKTVFREFEIPINQIIPTWNKAKLPQEMEDAMRENPTMKKTLIEGTIYRENDFKYDFYVMTNDGEMLLEETIDESPFIVFRENVVPGETFGRGRLMSLISDIKTLNKAVELGLKGAELAIVGAFTAVDDGVINVNNINIKPGAIIPVSSNSNADMTLKPLTSPANFQVEQLFVNEIRQRINDLMLAEPFGNIQDTSVRSATEMNIRQNDFIQTSIASFSRLQTELLSKVINKVIHILKTQGKIEDLNVDNKQIAIKYSSPLAKIQGVEELTKYQQFIEMMQSVPPEVVQGIVKFDKIPSYIAEALSLNNDLLRTPDEQKELMEQFAEQQGRMGQEQVMAQEQGIKQ